MILVAATLYGFGKTFFWPTMLGVVSERFPKGGALTLEHHGGVGMLAVGILGNPLLGQHPGQSGRSGTERASHPAIHATVMAPTKTSVFGQYQPVDDDKVKAADARSGSKSSKKRRKGQRRACT